MAKFLFVYRGGNDAEREMTPDQMQQVMQKWGAWIGEAMQKGWMVDPGDGLLPEGRVVRGKVVNESKEIVGGYSVVEAPTIDAAAELAKGCPALLYGGAVEVRTLAGLSANM